MSMENINKLCDDLIGYTKTKDAAMFLGGHCQQTQNTIKTIHSRFVFLDTNEYTKTDDSEMSAVSSEVSYQSDVILFKPVSQPYLQFVQGMALLLSNWNINTVKDVVLKERLVYMDRLTKSHLTNLELMHVLRKQIDNARMAESKSIQPVELAKHYLASLDSCKCEEKKCENAPKPLISGKKVANLKWDNTI